uniref:hypothetical protein n=1 Tax=Okeania sp. SIO2F4 TaxID=2607790 RepID=UPI0025E8E7F7|nr:hypothetical protein [Okeania sp. SIO2F4]
MYVISYNKWFADINYRQELSSQLNLEFSDAGINEVKWQGSGSSFDGLSFQSKGSEMNVLGRWQEFVNDPLYCSLLNNQELIDYSEKIFGYIPGTESLPIGKS